MWAPIGFAGKMLMLGFMSFCDKVDEKEVMSMPNEALEKVVDAGEKKANMPVWKMLVLGALAGAFIAFAGMGATIGGSLGGKIASACIFPAGLAMVIVAGSELFTGNSLMVVALLSRRIGVGGLLKNWAFVFLGNLIGASIVTLIVVCSGALDSVMDTVVATATAKVSMGFFEAMLRGVLCNFLVCIAVWMAFAAKTVSGKILAVFFPVMLFVLCGFEHSIANMYYVPAGLFAKMLGLGGGEGLTVANMWLCNLIPVTIGNVIGGAFFVGGGYYLAYGRNKKRE